MLASYVLIVLLGKVRAQQNIYYVDEQHLVDDSIRDRMVYNFEEGATELRALGSPVTLLKVHKVWIRIAQQEQQGRQNDYVRQKLLRIPFFQALSFSEFSKVLAVAQLSSIGPGSTLVPELSVPYNMYIVTEGELVLRKKVRLTEEAGLWQEMQSSLQKNDGFSQQLFEYLVREPPAEKPTFEVTFEIASLGESSILCGSETLNELPLGYSVCSSLTTKYVAIKYPDLYVLDQSRLTDIRGWPTR
jgi:hypothetical protein